MLGAGLITTVDIARALRSRELSGAPAAVPQLPAEGNAETVKPGQGGLPMLPAVRSQAMRALLLLQALDTDAAGERGAAQREVVGRDPARRMAPAGGEMHPQDGALARAAAWPSTALGGVGRAGAAGRHTDLAAALPADGPVAREAEASLLRSAPGTAAALGPADPAAAERRRTAQAEPPWLATPAGLALLGAAMPPADPRPQARAPTAETYPWLRCSFALAVTTLLLAGALWLG